MIRFLRASFIELGILVITVYGGLAAGLGSMAIGGYWFFPDKMQDCPVVQWQCWLMVVGGIVLIVVMNQARQLRYEMLKHSAVSKLARKIQSPVMFDENDVSVNSAKEFIGAMNNVVDKVHNEYGQFHVDNIKYLIRVAIHTWTELLLRSMKEYYDLVKKESNND